MVLPTTNEDEAQPSIHRNDIMTSMPLRLVVLSSWLATGLLADARNAAAQTGEPYPGLDAYITKAVQTWKIPGAAVAIVRNDSVIYARGFGVLATGTRTPVNERTLFEIGSSSKAFTATTIAMLVGEGKMRWDAPLTTYLPDFRMYDAVANGAVTVRDALSHRSGIARGELVWVGAGISRDEVLRRVRFLKPESPFRSQYSYQNMMFLAAGQAAGKAAGSSWDELIPQRLFGPLGMTSSVTTYRGLTNANVATPHGMDHDTASLKPPFDAENIAPAGSILSSAVDMAQWLRFQLNDGVVNGKRLVTSAALRETHSPQMLVPRGAAAAAAAATGADTAVTTHFNTYGMGWFIEDYRGQLAWQHGGNTPGMTTAVGMLPEKRFGVVVLSNMQSTPLPGVLERYIFDRELSAPMRDLSAEAYARSLVQRRRADSVTKAQEAAHIAGASPPLPLSAYAGTFADSLYGAVRVVLKDGQLELEHGDWRGPLEYWNASNFRWKVPPSAPVGPMFIKFDVAPDNTVSGLYFGLGADVTLLSRVRATRGAPGGGT
jgi:CubicO group peptidase (beta-lactamase class C family)